MKNIYVIIVFFLCGMQQFFVGVFAGYGEGKNSGGF